MRLTCFFLVFLFSTITANAQKFAVGTLVKVLDYGQIISTPNWDAAAKSALSSQVGDQVETIILKSNEASWPTGIGSLNGRNTNRAKMSEYIVFYLAALPNGQALLFVPAIENSYMQEDMRPNGDIYFLIGEYALEVKANEPPPAYLQEVDFAKGMETITQDYKNGFLNLFTSETQEDEDGFTTYHGCGVPLEGTEYLLFFEDLMSGSTGFHAAFPGDVNPAVAILAYEALVRKVEALKLTCCPLSKQEEIVNGNAHRQRFYVDNPDALDYWDMVIEVSTEQGEGFDDNGEIVSVWTPMLYIYSE